MTQKQIVIGGLALLVLFLMAEEKSGVGLVTGARQSAGGASSDATGNVGPVDPLVGIGMNY